MASLFEVFKTFRPRRTILSEDFNALQTSLKASFDRIGQAPPSGETGVSTTFHCADPVLDQHAVTKGYFETVANPVFAPNIEEARQWAEQDDDTDVNGISGARSAKHWAGQAESVIFAGAASPAQGANADTAFGWGDHALAGYASTDTAESFTSVSLGSWTIAEVGGKLVFSDSGVAKFSIDTNGKVTADDDVAAYGAP